MYSKQFMNLRYELCLQKENIYYKEKENKKKTFISVIPRQSRWTDESPGSKVTLLLKNRLVFLSFCLTVLLSFCLSVFLFFCLSVFLSFCLSVLLSYCLLSFCLSVILSFCLFVFLSFCLSVILSFCLSVFLSLINWYLKLWVFFSRRKAMAAEMPQTI